MKTIISKTALARSLGISRQALYYKPKRPHKDEVLRDRILKSLDEHPAYGYRRIALHLGINKKRVQRVMQMYSIRPKIRQKKRYPKNDECVGGVVPNRLKSMCPISPDAIWAGDFTRLWFFGRPIYLATVIDTYTREIIAWQIGIHHTAGLIMDVLKEAKRKRQKTPHLFHSDQGSEYTATKSMHWLAKEKIEPSWSPKGKPWNNGIQESFFRTFKLEFGKAQRHDTMDKLIEEIGKYMHYYNTKRIHSRLKTTPQEFRKNSC